MKLLAVTAEKRDPAVPDTPTLSEAGVPGIEGRDLSSLRQCSSGGAPMPFEVQGRVERLIGSRIGGGWGINTDLSGKLSEDWRQFNAAFIPVYMENHPDKSRARVPPTCRVQLPAWQPQ